MRRETVQSGLKDKIKLIKARYESFVSGFFFSEMNNTVIIPVWV